MSMVLHKWLPRIFYKKFDGGKESGVTGYFLIEWKKVISHNDTWALTFRGPWDDIWYEYDKYGNKIELTHGRRVINER